VHWRLYRLNAVSEDMPGIKIPCEVFMGSVGVLP